jgi:hypothetical protein
MANEVVVADVAFAPIIKPVLIRVDPTRRVVTAIGLLFAGLLLDEIPSKMYKPAVFGTGIPVDPLTPVDCTE